MLRPKHRSGTKPRAPTPADRNPLNAYARSFLEWSAVHGRSTQTVETRARALKRFIAWCDERDLVHPKDVTLPILERYQRYLYHYRKPNGAPLTFGSQQTLLAPLKGFFQWAARERHLLYNPASELLLPRLPRRLPHHILSIADIENILNQPDLETPAGVRDRAMLETLYSSGSVAWSWCSCVFTMSTPAVAHSPCVREKAAVIGWCPWAHARRPGWSDTSRKCARCSSPAAMRACAS